MKYYIVFFSLVFLVAFESKADTITFWHFHKNELSIGDHCFDNKVCFHHDLILEKSEIISGDIFQILFGGCEVPETLTISLISVDGKFRYSFFLIPFGRGSFIIEGKKLLKLIPGNYRAELFCDRGDEWKYSGNLELK